MNGNWFNAKKYGVLGDGRKITKRSPSDNPTRFIIQSFYKKLIGMISMFVRVYTYIVITCKVQAKLSIKGNSCLWLMLNNSLRACLLH